MALILPALLAASGTAVVAFTGGWPLSAAMIALGALAGWAELHPRGADDAKQRADQMADRFAAEIDARSNYRGFGG